MPKVNIKNWLIVGGISALITPFLMMLLNAIPMFQVTFSTLAINLRSKIVGLSGLNLSNFLLGLTGLDFSLPTMILSVVGGALMVLAARYIFEYLPFKNLKKQQKLVAIFVIAGLLDVFVGAGFSIPSVALLVGFLLNGVVMAYIIKYVSEQFGLNIM